MFTCVLCNIPSDNLDSDGICVSCNLEDYCTGCNEHELDCECEWMLYGFSDDDLDQDDFIGDEFSDWEGDNWEDDDEWF